MGDLLRAVRVLGPVFRLLGRYRAATWISLVLAVGWLIVGLAPRGDAATGAESYRLNGSDRLAQSLGHATGALYLVGALSVVVAFGVLGAVTGAHASRVRHAGQTLRHGAFAGLPDVPDARLGTAARVSWVADGRRLEALIDGHISGRRLP